MTSQRFPARIKVQYVNNPKEGAFSGSVKDVQGNYWSVPGTRLYLFQPGGEYDIEYWQKQSGNRVYNNIASVNGQSFDEPAGQAPLPQQPRPQAPAPRPQTPAPLPQPQSTREDNTDRYIFITGVVGRAMGSGKYGTLDIKELALAARDAWEALHAPPAPPTQQAGPQPPFDDEIPY